MKYIVLQHTERSGNVKQTGLAFTPNLIHKDVADRMCHLLAMEEGYMAKVVGAGFIVMRDGRSTCSGRSDSLKIGSRGEEDSVVFGL